MRDQPATITAPAKVNLFLAIGGRRPDGYHEITTVMQTISLADGLEFHPALRGVTLECHHPSLTAGRGNLCVGAALATRALARRRGLTQAGVHIILHKTIPVQAGLGGGSSDAAATLIALNHLWRLGLTAAELTSLAARQGSDVPFFLHRGTALAAGRGEIVIPLPPLQRALPLVLVKPGIGVPTAWAYQEWDRRRLASQGDCARMIGALACGDLRAISQALHNDFENVVFEEYPALRAIKRELIGAGCLGALLCGSGSALFGIAPDRQTALRAASLLKREYGWALAARTVGRVG